MKILVIGSGGREDAIIRACLKSQKCSEVIACPGNDGVAERVRCIPTTLSKPTDNAVQAVIENLGSMVESMSIDLTIVGQRQYFAQGIVNGFQKRGLRIYGPTMEDAEIESKKEVMKNLARKLGVPTAEFQVCRSIEEVDDFLDQKMGQWQRFVIKDSEALDGHSVFIVDHPYQVQRFARIFFSRSKNPLLIENYLEGPEKSAFAFVHKGKFRFWCLIDDWKMLFDGDMGPTTGSMGSASANQNNQKLIDAVCTQIFSPFVSAMPNYTGVLYAGLKIPPDGPKLLEFNAGFGDSETQVTLARLESDFVEHIEAAIDGRLDEINCRWSREVAVAVTLVPWGYPKTEFTGFKIDGIEQAEQVPSVEVLFAGVDGDRKQGYRTKTNRSLNVLAKGQDFHQARERAYQAIDCIQFPGMHYRKDIAKEFE